MRPCNARDEVSELLETSFYDCLKDSDVAEKALEIGHKQSIEEIAEVLTAGMMQSPCGDLARALAQTHKDTADYPQICQVAFKKTIIRLLTEKKGMYERS